MIAHELISEEIKPLSIEMDGETALQLMQQYGVNHLPVCDGTEYKGIVSEEDIMKHGTEVPLEVYSYSLDFTHSLSTDHLFEVMKKTSDSGVSVMPVLREENEYLGAISKNDLFEYYTKSFAFSEPGSILVIHLHNSQYSLSEISHIIEAENAIVLSSILSRPLDGQIILTLKVDKTDISRIVAALRRYEYDVSASYSEEEVVDNFKERYDALMRFLDV